MAKGTRKRSKSKPGTEVPEGDRAGDIAPSLEPLAVDIPAHSPGSEEVPPVKVEGPARSAPAVDVEALQQEMEVLAAALPVDERGVWRARLESIDRRRQDGKVAREEVYRLRRDMDARLFELELLDHIFPRRHVSGKAAPPPRYVMVLDLQGQVLASRGDAANPDFGLISKALQLTVPRLAPGTHILSHKVGGVGIVIGAHGVVAATFEERPTATSLGALTQTLKALEEKDANALAATTDEERKVIDRYAEDCLRLLQEPPVAPAALIAQAAADMEPPV